MEKQQTLADILGVQDQRPEDVRPATDFEELVDISDPTIFCQRILQTREFRQYIMNGIVLGDLPPAIVGRIMDHALGKPPERIEHTGKDGAPIESVTEVRRIIIHVADQQHDDVNPYTTH